MRTLLFALIISFPSLLIAQGVRVDIPLWTSGPNVPTSGGALPQSLLLANSKVSICVNPAPTLGACTPVPTYTDKTLVTPCPSSAPIVQLPGSACLQTTGTRGNLGFWYAGGVVDYWVQSSYGTFGPFTTSGGTTGPPGTPGAPGPPGPAGPPGSGSISGQAANVVGLAGTATAITAQSHINEAISGFTSVTQPIAPTFVAASALPLIDPRHPSFAGGMVCDGSTDIGPALQAAWNSLPPHGGEIQITGTAENPCYWANPTTFTWGSKGTVTWNIQGTLQTGTTLSIPSGVRLNLIGKSGIFQAQFQGPGPTASIKESPISGGAITGTLGTDVVTTDGTAATVTFTPSSMHGIFAGPVATEGTALTIVDIIACTITSITRTSNVAVATLSGACHIPPNVPLTVAGVTDSTFNGAYNNGDASPHPFLARASDYVLNTLTWKNTGSNATSSGGTVSGFNEDTYENVQVTAVTSTTATATFYRPHTAAAKFGAVGLNISQPSAPGHLIQDLTIAGDGTAFWVGQDYKSTYERIGVTATGACTGNPTSLPIDIGDGAFLALDGIGLTVSCGPWNIHMGQPYNTGYAGAGPIYITNSFIGSGIKLDHGGVGVSIKNSVFEQGTRAMISFDPTNFWACCKQYFKIENSGLQDSAEGMKAGVIFYTTPIYGSGNQRANADLSNIGSVDFISNDYFSGNINNNMTASTAPFSQSSTPIGLVGTYSDGKVIDAEVRGEQASMQPAIIPYPSLPVITNPASWPTGTCAVTTGQLAPDGTATAGQIVNTGSSVVETFHVPGAPAVGDVVLFGGWVYAPGGGVAQGATTAYLLDNGGGSHFHFQQGIQSLSSLFDTQLVNDWYHPVVAMATISDSDGTTSQTIHMSLQCGVRPLNFWQPFMFYIPASAGIPIAEINRWQQQLLHGYVPSGGQTNTLYAHYPIDLENNPIVEDTVNNTASGATLNALVCSTLVSSALKAQTCPTSSPYWSGIAIGGATGSTAGNTQVAKFGRAACIFDGATTISHYVQVSTSVAGDCTDTGSTTYPTSGTVIGRVATTNAGAGTTSVVNMYSPGIVASSGGGGGGTLTEWSSGGVKTAGTVMLANNTQLWSFELPASLTSTKITYTPSTADNSGDLYDIGIYANDGSSLICDAGPTAGTTFAPNTNPVTLSWLASCPLVGGTRYLLALTDTVATAILNTGGAMLIAVSKQTASSGGGTSGGQLNSSLTPSADNWSVSFGFPQISLHN